MELILCLILLLCCSYYFYKESIFGINTKWEKVDGYDHIEIMYGENIWTPTRLRWNGKVTENMKKDMEELKKLKFKLFIIK